MVQENFASRLKSALSSELPGITAQEQLAIVNRNKFNPSDRALVKEAAVTALIYPGDDEHFITYIKRKAHKKDRHSGQISFPGGKRDKTDTSIRYAARRELKEEISVSLTASDYLGALSPLYIPVSNFLVHPFVAFLDHKPEMKPEEAEVALIVSTSLDKLLQKNIQRKQISGQGYTIPNAPYFDIEGYTLWGATAMITNELLEVIRTFS